MKKVPYFIHARGWRTIENYKVHKCKFCKNTTWNMVENAFFVKNDLTPDEYTALVQCEVCGQCRIVDTAFDDLTPAVMVAKSRRP